MVDGILQAAKRFIKTKWFITGSMKLSKQPSVSLKPSAFVHVRWTPPSNQAFPIKHEKRKILKILQEYMDVMWVWCIVRVFTNSQHTAWFRMIPARSRTIPARFCTIPARFGTIPARFPHVPARFPHVPAPQWLSVNSLGNSGMSLRNNRLFERLQQIRVVV